MLKKLIYLLMIVLASNIVCSATIHGTIYNNYLEEQYDVIITLNTTPHQTFVSKNATYSFDIQKGDYEIKAEHYKGTFLESYALEKISIESEGDYFLDIILFPNFQEEHEILEETAYLDKIDTDIDEEEDLSFWYVIAILSFVMFISLVYIFYTHKKDKAHFKGSEKDEEPEDEEAKKIFDFIKSNKRTTQKDIRKEFPSSEAKISLILSDLESRGKIKKIKKGRGNIILII